MGYTIGEERLYEVYKAISISVQQVCDHGVHGHIAEFGTYAGVTAECLALVMAYCRKTIGYSDRMHNISPRRLHLFDSFEGLPATSNKVDEVSPHVVSLVWRPGHLKGLPPDKLMEKVSAHLPKEDISIYPGWFKDSLPRVESDVKFGLVHIDCDLYESNIQVLDWLFLENRLTDGAILLFDDWNSNRASPDFGERRAWREILSKFSPHYSDCGYYGLGGRKFIIHRA